VGNAIIKSLLQAYIVQWYQHSPGGAIVVQCLLFFGDWWLVPLRFARRRHLYIHSLGGTTCYFAAL